MNNPTVTIYYEADHDRLDELFKKFQEFKRSDPSKSRGCFKEFKLGLQRHIVWEEEILFPLFEQKTGLFHGGPTEVMRQEHRLIGAHLENIHEKVKQCNPESDHDEQLLLSTLFLHNQKEEQILYPAIDHSITGQERANVFSSMTNIPEEKYAHCCSSEPRT